MADIGPTPDREKDGANQPPEPSGTEEVLLRRYFELANKRKHEVANKRQREEERRKTLLEGKPVFFCAFGANPLEDDSCISPVRFPFRIL